MRWARFYYSHCYYSHFTEETKTWQGLRSKELVSSGAKSESQDSLTPRPNL